jgi:hypothetical protein
VVYVSLLISPQHQARVTSEERYGKRSWGIEVIVAAERSFQFLCTESSSTWININAGRYYCQALLLIPSAPNVKGEAAGTHPTEDGRRDVVEN